MSSYRTIQLVLVLIACAILGAHLVDSKYNGFFCERSSEKNEPCVIVKPIETSDQTIGFSDIYKTHLHIQSNKATKFLLDNIGCELPNLKFYEVNNCSVEILQRKHFANMTKLETLSLADNLIQGISKDVFCDLKVIKSLNLSGNKLGSPKQIKNNFLTPMTSLQVLDLSANNMTKLWRERIKILVNLESFFMSNNNLKTLHIDSFANNTKLSWIKLDGNKITTLKVEVFEALSNLKSVDLTGNLCINSSFGSENLKSLIQVAKHLRNSCQSVEKKCFEGCLTRSPVDFSFLILASFSLCLYILILTFLCVLKKFSSAH